MTKRERTAVALEKWGLNKQKRLPRYKGPGKYSRVNAVSQELRSQQITTEIENPNGNGHLQVEGVLFARLSQPSRRNNYDGRPAKPNRALAFKGR